jgi:hypothetical protein
MHLLPVIWSTSGGLGSASRYGSFWNESLQALHDESKPSKKDRPDRLARKWLVTHHILFNARKAKVLQTLRLIRACGTPKLRSSAVFLIPGEIFYAGSFWDFFSCSSWPWLHLTAHPVASA